MLFLQHWQQLLVIESLGVIEVNRHFSAERFVAVGNHIKQVTHGNDVAYGQRLTLIDQQLHHHFQGGAFPLQHAGNGDQSLHQRRAKRIHLAKHFAIAVTGQQCVHHGFADLLRLLKRPIEFLSSGLAPALEHTFLGDGRQVAVLQRDRVESPFLPAHRVIEVQSFDAGHGITDQVAKIALTSNKTDDRHRPIRSLGLDQFCHLRDLSIDETDIRGAAGQPED